VLDVVKLPLGKQEPVDADWIRIEQTAEAIFKLTASPKLGEVTKLVGIIVKQVMFRRVFVRSSEAWLRRHVAGSGSLPGMRVGSMVFLCCLNRASEQQPSAHEPFWHNDDAR
jgi:hypothetical protein